MIRLRTLRKNVTISDNRVSCKYVAEFTVNTGNSIEKLFDNLPKFILDKVSSQFPEIVDYKKGNMTISLSRTYIVDGMNEKEMKSLAESNVIRDGHLKAKRILTKIGKELENYTLQFSDSIIHCDRIVDDEVEFIEALLDN